MNNYQYLQFKKACQEENLDKIMKYAVNINNFPNLQNSNRYPPIFTALDSENFEVIELVLKLGADTNISLGQNNGYTYPLRYIIANSIDSYKDGFTKRPDIEIIKLLVKYGANINKIGNDGKSPLDCAISLGHKLAENYLKSLGAKKSTLYLLYLLHVGTKINLEEIDKNEYIEMIPTIDDLKDCSGNLLHYDVLYVWYLKDSKDKELEDILAFRTKTDSMFKKNSFDKKGRTSLDLALEVGFKSAEHILRKYGEKLSNEIKRKF